MEEKLPSSSNPNPEPIPRPDPVPRPQNATISGRVVPITRSPPPPPPPSRPRKHQRSCLCSLFLFLVFLLFALVFMLAIATGVFYVVYRPYRPSYSVTSLNIVSFNLTGRNQLSSRLNLTVAARNPNSKIAFLYDPILVTATYDGAPIAGGSFLAFVQGTKNTTTLEALMEGFDGIIDDGVANGLKRSTRRLGIKIEMETRVRVEIGGFKSKKLGARVSCDGVEVAVPYNQTVAHISHSKLDAKCEISLLVQTWKWTF